MLCGVCAVPVVITDMYNMLYMLLLCIVIQPCDETRIDGIGFLQV